MAGIWQSTCSNCSKSRAASFFMPDILRPNRRIVRRPNVGTIEYLWPGALCQLVREATSKGSHWPVVEDLNSISTCGDENPHEVGKGAFPDPELELMKQIRYE